MYTDGIWKTIPCHIKMKPFSVILFFCFSFSFSQQNFYVSTQGNDGNDGLSLENSFFTLERAKQAVKVFKQKNAGFRQDVIVNISPGIYAVAKPLKFTKSDSGNKNSVITYRKNPSQTGDVVFSGGKKIGNWELFDASKNIWKTNIGKQYSRQIFYKNKKSDQISKAVRAKSDFLSMREYSDGFKSKTKNVDFKDWKNIRDMEIISNLYWVSTRIPVMENNGKKKLIVEPLFWDHIHLQWGVEKAPFNWLENALELVNEPNEWYIDRLANPDEFTLYYQFGNDSPENLEIILPVAEKLIEAENIQHISFENIYFELTTWSGPSVYIPERNTNNGFRTGLGDRYTEYSHKTGIYKNMAQIPGAVSFNACGNIKISGCSFRHIGSTAIEFSGSSSHNLIENSTISDVSGSGISFHNWVSADLVFNEGFAQLKKKSGDKAVGTGNKIIQNTIYNVANEYFSSCGIVIGYAQNTEISKNKISGFPYSGIAFISFTYDIIKEDGTISNPDKILFFGKNIVSENKIDCSEQILPDGGGIYNLGYHGNEINIPNSQRSEFFDNTILNQKFYQGAIYLDKFSANIDVYDNVIDIENNQSIIQKHGNEVYGVACRYNSRNISIYRNSINDRYLPTSQYCIDGPCENVIVSKNEYFSGFGKPVW